ncbi:MerR-like DNA binding protein [Roseibium hamelinense]|uniref:MerR-like DNA binding protein n=1 Tax=Roseibium hamelinense TaxID=150831 RepID=A0A562SJ28_9HYPH|nr:MerR family transcriptional regulator [Roseibium hamelinense]MTI43879.1 MerR family transcriptional regulator [Roseibium hamelinense]TWI80826.1 MerR-like DNA binding protein [Roseibium hamelinense]
MSNRVDIEIPEFTQADVIRITGVSAKTLQNWTDPNRGILRLSQDGVGKGRRRLYSALDIMAVTMIAHLSALGVSPNLVSQLFYKPGAKVGDWLRVAAENLDKEYIGRIVFDADGLFANLISSPEDNERFAYGDDWARDRMAFIQVSLTRIASYVAHGINDIQFDETPDDQKSETDKAIRAARDELLKNRKKAKLP